MNKQNGIITTEVSFKMFLFENKRNRTILWLITAAVVLQFTIFKYLYPYASYIHGDSFAYLYAADDNQSINTYLIGYSKFLRLFSVFAKADYILVAFQYLFVLSCVLFLLSTILYFYRTRSIFKIILLCFLVFNPLFLHMANMISSDAFFLALSCSWFALLLWIIHKPTNKILIWHAVVLFIAFTVRYNALIYPLISVIAICYSKISIRRKVIGVSSFILLCGWFIIFTMFQYKKLTGVWQYSPFSGWQLANNAMYTYRYVDRSIRKPVPKKFQVLDNMIRQYFDSTRDIKRFPSEDWKASTVYMWTPTSSLYKYRNQLFKEDTAKAAEFKKWASIGPFYKEYGLYIIKKYPFHFLKYFVWPNANKYYAPPVEFLEIYNGGTTTIPKIVKQWFGYSSQTIKPRSKDLRVTILNFYPILSGTINLAMLCFLIFFWLLKGWKYKNEINRGLAIGGIFWFSNAMFTIFASSVALRFQAFPIILTIIYVIILFNWMFQLMDSMRTESKDFTDLNKISSVEMVSQPLLRQL